MLADWLKALLAAPLLLLNLSAADPMDPANPSCPKSLNWSTYPEMKFSTETIDGVRVLKAEGQIDEDVALRLEEAIKAEDPQEIWLRSPGGNARAGNAAGKVIRSSMIPTRIPPGWACFSACNFMFMGGAIRFVDPGAHFVVHMFTHVGDKDAVRSELKKGADHAIGMIGEVEQDSALLASEDNDFLIRMGVSRKLLTEVMYQQKAVSGGSGDTSSRRCLTREEAFKYNVANAQ
ncbi:MAG TPA: hypothetical protein VIL42_07625 [Sphingomicrobium sp.]|jgi:hypothetical protein